MTTRDKSLLTIASALRECDSHLFWLRRGHAALAGRFPLEETTLKQLAAGDVMQLDQFLYRFIKLQDSLGARLFPALHAWLHDSPGPVAFLDLLASLEKFGAIPSENDWQFFRNLRNNLAHDYPESAGQTVLTLNALFAEWAKMEGLYQTVRRFCTTRIAGLATPETAG